MQRPFWVVQTGSMPTLIRVIYLAWLAVLVLDYGAMQNLNNPTLKYLNILVPVLGFITTLSLCWVFVLQSRYALSIKDTILYSFTRIIAFPIRTLFMGLTLIIPLLICYFFNGLVILVFFFGITVPGILATCFYNYALKVMENDLDSPQENTEESSNENDEEVVEE